MSEFHELSILSLNKVTEDCVSMGFSIPEGLKENFNFKAGQYITIKAKIDGEELRRDYSICTSPFSNEFRVAVKKVEGGVFSNYANSVLSANDLLEVSEPRGRFIYEPEESNIQTIVAFAAGSGITPVMSIIKTALSQERDSKFILVYGNKAPKDTIFLDEILELQSRYPDRFFVHFIFSQSQESDALFGRIDKSTVNFILKNNYKNEPIKAFYLCGPEAMINTVSDLLKENQVEERKILFELFTKSSSNEENFSEIKEGETIVTILVDDEETSFTMSQKKSVLEAALENNIDAPYSCQGGICSSCLARITTGSATMRQNNILTDQEVEDGLILTCQAHPTSSEICIDYDDV
ncbi:MAG: ferredoxin--NADP reductase [Bacteroidia bacterium]|nr:ferredoxin--NADP reductase [Bacteroidia bacterium]NND10444.1 ferredoxin--NADP reductase [Flavobacteriaceae bacterium]MBT8309538.1 ferredoxin--NADP reductase [Bacteroidia bacterium]NNK27365.1 ferredoxin--NADP reductase [Flavobacteriaceae bacterium]NNL60001.1 ferredoxin--NADP reductase [Flavobacteriaceae bacterium]